MPIKYLPGFIQRLLKSKQQNPEEDEYTSFKGVNLIPKEDSTPLKKFYVEHRFNNFLLNISMLGLIIFIILVGINSYLDVRLEEQRSKSDALVAEIDTYYSTVLAGTTLQKKIDYYKETLNKRQMFGDKAKTIFTGIEADTYINALDLSWDKFYINVVLANPKAFAKMMVHYLNSRHMSELTITSAIFDVNKKVYFVSFEGKFL